MRDFLDVCFAWPTLPASILLILTSLYWLLVIAGAADIELFDFDMDLDVDTDASILDLGFVPLRFLNLGSVPLMLWLSVFSLCFWSASQMIDGATKYSDVGEIAAAVFRNAGIAVFVTKVLTQPLRGKFDHVEPLKAKELIGGTCVITTGEANQKFGEAQFATEGAPLTLTVRVVEGSLAKGEQAEIVDFSPEENIYFVRSMNPEE